MGFLLIDQVFALAAKRLSQDGRPDGRQHWYMFGCGVPIYIGWVVATGVGWFAGNALQYLRSFGLGAALNALDFVIYAIYIGLVMSSFTSRRAVVAGLAGGALALVLYRLPFQMGLFCAVLLVLVGMALWERRARRLAADTDAADTDSPRPHR